MTCSTCKSQTDRLTISWDEKTKKIKESCTHCVKLKKKSSIVVIGEKTGGKW